MVLACCFSFYGELHKKASCTRDKGAVGNDINAIQAQESLKRIMEFLKLHPEQALAVHHALEAGFFVGKVNMELAACWPPTYMYFNQVPKYWLCGWLQNLNHKFDKSLAQAVDKSDKDALRMLVEFITGLKPQVKLPRACLCKSVLAATLMKRAALLGNRLTDVFIQKAIDADSGAINYKDYGVYTWEPSEMGMVKRIKHRGGVVAVVPEEVCIKKGWLINDNHSDIKANINHGVLFLKFSQQMTDFNKYVEYCSAENFKAGAEQVQKELEEIKLQSTKDDVHATPEVLPKPKKRSGPPAGSLNKKLAVASVAPPARK